MAHYIVLNPVFRLVSVVAIVAYVGCLLLYSEDMLIIEGDLGGFGAAALRLTEGIIVVFFIVQDDAQTPMRCVIF